MAWASNKLFKMDKCGIICYEEEHYIYLFVYLETKKGNNE